MAAAHPVHYANGRAHHGNGAGMITAPMRQHSLTHWQRRITQNGRKRAASSDGISYPIQ